MGGVNRYRQESPRRRLSAWPSRYSWRACAESNRERQRLAREKQGEKQHCSDASPELLAECRQRVASLLASWPTGDTTPAFRSAQPPSMPLIAEVDDLVVLRCGIVGRVGYCCHSDLSVWSATLMEVTGRSTLGACHSMAVSPLRLMNCSWHGRQRLKCDVAWLSGMFITSVSPPAGHTPSALASWWTGSASWLVGKGCMGIISLRSRIVRGDPRLCGWGIWR
jgi:hypothetical protein